MIGPLFIQVPTTPSGQAYDRQRQMDESVRKLFNTMNALYKQITEFRKRVSPSGSQTLDVGEDVLLRVVRCTVNCSYFIQDYCSPSFSMSHTVSANSFTLMPFSAGRFLENLVKSTTGKVAEFTKAFEDMKKEFKTEVFEGTYIVTTVILGEVKDLRDDVKDLRNDVKDLSKSWYSDSQLATCTTCNLHDVFRR